MDSAALEQFEFETALALSKTADEEARAAASSEDTAIARAKRLSLQPVCCGGKAEALSYKLWDSDRWAGLLILLLPLFFYPCIHEGRGEDA